MKAHLTPIIFGIAVLVMGYLTFMRSYPYPERPIFDEYYHIPSAMNYLSHDSFMEPHPPLGKLFIALGEVIIHPNKSAVPEHSQSIPPSFKYAGVRFFPVLFAVFSGAVFYLLLYQITGKIFISFLTSCLYLFDNAIVVHSRAAQLDSIQIFFVLIFLSLFVHAAKKIMLQKREVVGVRLSALLGLLLGVILSIKLSGMAMVLFFVCLILLQTRFKKGNTALNAYKRIVLPIIVFFSCALLILTVAYIVHIFLTAKNGQVSVSRFPRLIYENIKYIRTYESQIPTLSQYNKTHILGIGSGPLEWPFGRKAVRYVWSFERNGAMRYLYLQCNPVIWIMSLLGILSGTFLTARNLLSKKRKNADLSRFLTQAFTIGYWGYMASMVAVNRVLYLYHYFIPLLMGSLLLSLGLVDLTEKMRKKYPHWTYLMPILIWSFVVLAFWFYSPITYFVPITKEAFLKRALVPFWGLVWVGK